MTHEQTDLRVRRTQMNLREALIDLIEEKGFDAVTVGDIAERAMVNRATFYRHYPDKYALVTGIFEEAVKQMLREIPLPESFGAITPASSATEDEARQHDAALAVWSALFEHLARHARLYQVMLGKRGSSWFTAQVRDSFAEAIRSRAKILAKLGLSVRATDDPNVAPLEFVILCLANWFVGVLSWWIENGMLSSPQQMARWSARTAYAIAGAVTPTTPNEQ
ncbi:TetR/AcrR family transcriptional regulator [Ktedonosporobacter rubrisoli]|uniref:TetR/AcrR family transcriptional regulator n=1 Tax=Ktedonosporobacter rubrisoli TaxID=2509675 RepID=A0A4P6JHX5_KTERU|nr:TetR/AcrR family transcriptional regulator [Ktedonosporobacter rubrisoli]QBD74648.1 TetR/AcrR family transcriptional regulator [Ktedonosporobacter rubrisoli]